ncbi:MAG: hypothetical protein OD918_00240, partial [Gammaproteobacteria bacterium]
MNAPRFFRRLCAAAAVAVLTIAWLAPAHAATKPGPPMIQLVPERDYFAVFWTDPENPGDPPATEYRIRHREAGMAEWSNMGGADGVSTRTPFGTSHCAAGAYRTFAQHLAAIAANPTQGGYGGYAIVQSIYPAHCSTSRERAAGRTVEVQVAYVNSAGIGEWSALHRVTAGAPQSPVNPMVARGAGGFKIEWMSGDVIQETFSLWKIRTKVPSLEVITTGHRVRWRKEGESAYAYANDLAKSARSHFQAGLETGETYYVSVAGTSAHGTSQWTAELPVIAGGPPFVKAWVGKVGGIDVRWASDPDATKDEARWRNPGLRPLAEWTSLVTENPSGHYQLSHEDNDIEPGGRYEVQVREFADAAWQDWS